MEIDLPIGQFDFSERAEKAFREADDIQKVLMGISREAPKRKLRVKVNPDGTLTPDPTLEQKVDEILELLHTIVSLLSKD